MEQPTFRAMNLEDIEHICDIEKEAFLTPWTAEAFYNELVNNQLAHYIVMVLDGQIIGYGGLWAIMDEAHITNVAVRQDFRGRKYGERLMLKLKEMALQLGLRRMTLEVRVSNRIAQRLYTKLNFRPAGVRRGYYTDNCEDALIMWAELMPAQARKEKRV